LFKALDTKLLVECPIGEIKKTLEKKADWADEYEK
jgi:hypothetical protein